MAKKTKLDIKLPAETPPTPPPASNIAAANANKKPNQRWPFLVLKIFLYTIAIIVILGFAFSYKVIFSNGGIFSRQSSSPLDQLKHLVTSNDKQIEGESRDRVNIMLVGMGGAGHDGAYLADTIIVASIKPSTNEVAMLSIPRDLVVNIPDYGWRKINNANAFGYQTDPKQGGEKILAGILEDVLQQPIDYYGSVDFSGFKKLIDQLNGVDVTVDQAFTDYEYPTTNYGYQTISFKAGLQHMDGETALKYARSRHGNNGEGSDFARSKRQQKIISAVKKKALSLGTLANPKKIMDITDTIGQHLKTDMEIWELLRLVDLTKDIDQSQIITHVLDNSATGLLHTTTGTDGAYLLEPNAGLGNYSEIRDLAGTIFERSLLIKEQARIEIQNGTKNTAISQRIASDLIDIGLTISSQSATQDRNTKTTVIYDLTLGQKPATVEYLRKTLHAQVYQQRPAVVPTNKDLSQNVTNNSSYPTSSTLVNEQQPNPQSTTSDIVIVLGADQLATKSKTTNTNANTIISANLNTNSNLNVNSAVTNRNANTNSNTNTNVNSNTNRNSNANATVNQNVITNSNRNSNTNSH
ncbi:MAG: LCP family protein [Patescibacteria group bacterium]|jgi:LCP family protein required for cell wall assembly